jgi:hypothetical protein
MIKTKEVFVSSPTLAKTQSCKVIVILRDRVRVLRSRIKADGMSHTGLILSGICKDEIQELKHIIEVLDES